MIFAAAAFFWALVCTVVLMAVTGLFEDESNRRTILAWITLPLVLSLGSWVAVQSGRPAFRAVVWLSVLLVSFFVWIAVFSIGIYYGPVVFLLMLAAFAPWPGSKSETMQAMPPDPLQDENEGEKLEEAVLRDVLGGVGRSTDQ